MIEATQRKLREAQFFLQHLATESTKAVRNEPEAFGFYLSALLSAARSVTFALQYEQKEKYDAWFPHWLAGRGDDERRLFTFLKDQRNIELKQDGSELEMIYEYIPVSQQPIERHAYPAHGHHSFGPPGTSEVCVGVPKHLFSHSNTGARDVVAACRKYVTALTELVRDFIARHEPPSTTERCNHHAAVQISQQEVRLEVHA